MLFSVKQDKMDTVSQISQQQSTAHLSIVFLPGDGVGPELLEHAKTHIQAVERITGLGFHITSIPCGGKYYLENGVEWPRGSFEKCQQADAIFLGAVGHQVNGKTVMTKPGKPYKDSRMAGFAPVLGNRLGLNLFANVRPLKCYHGVKTKILGQCVDIWNSDTIDYVIIRENTEDAYSNDSEVLEDLVISKIKISKSATERIVRYAYKLAERRNRKKKVTCVDKSNAIEAHAYFRKIFTSVGLNEFPHIKRDYAYVDAFCLQQTTAPDNFDVVVAPNFVGDIISDNGAVVMGGLGVPPSGNIGDEHALFEPVHGSAPDIAGKDIANPFATFLSLAMMLEWLGHKHDLSILKHASKCMETSVAHAIRNGIFTVDLAQDYKGLPTSVVSNWIGEKFSDLLKTSIA